MRRGNNKHLNLLHPAEHGHFTEAKKGKVANAKAIHSSDPAIRQWPRYEQRTVQSFHEENYGDE